jgi:hypothetical protein
MKTTIILNEYFVSMGSIKSWRSTSPQIKCNSIAIIIHYLEKISLEFEQIIILANIHLKKEEKKVRNQDKQTGDVTIISCHVLAKINRSMQRGSFSSLLMLMKKEQDSFK